MPRKPLVCAYCGGEAKARRELIRELYRAQCNCASVDEILPITVDALQVSVDELHGGGPITRRKGFED